jgi:glycine cleavage system H lipoate-binding protein
MEGFRYIDIFATKGVEYVQVLGFLLAFVIIWKLLQMPARAPRPARVDRRRLPGPGDWFRMDDERYYHPGHAWAQPEDSQVVKVGMDDFAQKLLGTPEGVELPEIGSRLDQGGKGWRLRVHSKPIDMLSPVDGEVTAVNEAVLNEPGLIGEDPYDTGWLLKVRVPDGGRGLKNLLTGRFAKAWLDETVSSLRQRMAGNVGTVLQDGGMPISGFASSVAPDNWQELVEEFLLSR